MNEKVLFLCLAVVPCFVFIGGIIIVERRKRAAEPRANATPEVYQCSRRMAMGQKCRNMTGPHEAKDCKFTRHESDPCRLVRLTVVHSIGPYEIMIPCDLPAGHVGNHVGFLSDARRVEWPPAEVVFLKGPQDEETEEDPEEDEGSGI